jgi:hypothetical protein
LKKQPGYAVFLGLTIISTLAALSTLVPDASVNEASFLGYRSHCVWAPWSTIICLFLSATFCRIRVKKFKTEASPGAQ